MAAAYRRERIEFRCDVECQTSGVWWRAVGMTIHDARRVPWRGDWDEVVLRLLASGRCQDLGQPGSACAPPEAAPVLPADEIEKAFIVVGKDQAAGRREYMQTLRNRNPELKSGPVRAIAENAFISAVLPRLRGDDGA